MENLQFKENDFLNIIIRMSDNSYPLEHLATLTLGLRPRVSVAKCTLG